VTFLCSAPSPAREIYEEGSTLHEPSASGNLFFSAIVYSPYNRLFKVVPSFGNPPEVKVTYPLVIRAVLILLSPPSALLWLLRRCCTP